MSRRLLALGAIALSLSLAACGKGSSGADAGTSAPDSPSSAATTEPAAATSAPVAGTPAPEPSATRATGVKGPFTQEQLLTVMVAASDFPAQWLVSQPAPAQGQLAPDAAASLPKSCPLAKTIGAPSGISGSVTGNQVGQDGLQQTLSVQVHEFGTDAKAREHLDTLGKVGGCGPVNLGGTMVGFTSGKAPAKGDGAVLYTTRTTMGGKDITSEVTSVRVGSDIVMVTSSSAAGSAGIPAGAVDKLVDAQIALIKAARK